MSVSTRPCMSHHVSSIECSVSFYSYMRVGRFIFIFSLFLQQQQKKGCQQFMLARSLAGLLQNAPRTAPNDYSTVSYIQSLFCFVPWCGCVHLRNASNLPPTPAYTSDASSKGFFLFSFVVGQRFATTKGHRHPSGSVELDVIVILKGNEIRSL